MPKGWRGCNNNEAVVDVDVDDAHCTLCVDKDDIEQLLEVVPEALTNEEVLKLAQENIAEEVREKEIAGEDQEEQPQKISQWKF